MSLEQIQENKKEDQMFRLFEEQKIKFKRDGSFVHLQSPKELSVEVCNAIRHAGFHIYTVSMDTRPISSRIELELRVGLTRDY